MHPCGTSLIRNCNLLVPYSRTVPRALWWHWWRGAVSYERDTPAEFATLRKSARCSWRLIHQWLQGMIVHGRLKHKCLARGWFLSRRSLVPEQPRISQQPRKSSQMLTELEVFLEAHASMAPRNEVDAHSSSSVLLSRLELSDTQVYEP